MKQKRPVSRVRTLDKDPLRAYVGVSGGVDSSVAAALLRQEGYSVTGVFMRITDPSWTACPMKEDRRSAMRACAALRVPFAEIDLSEAYRSEVVRDMVESYRTGLTPNPDAFCNERVKFGVFFDWAMARGADIVATGHYAAVRPDEAGSPALFASVDAGKDQSYFLWGVRRERLSKIRFPLGDLKKTEVRVLAKKFGLPNARRKDSQGLCFIGDEDIRTFLARHIEEREGDVLDISGKVIGTHHGAWLYTLGERHGFRISRASPDAARLYVVKTDISANTITVGPQELLSRSGIQKIRLSRQNWLSDLPAGPIECDAVVRYHGPRHAVAISASRDEVSFRGAPPLIAPGQSAVFYEGDRLLGGAAVAAASL